MPAGCPQAAPPATFAAFTRARSQAMLRNAARHALALSRQLRSEHALRQCDAAALRVPQPAWRRGAPARASTAAELADEVFISEACAKVRA